MQFVAPKNVLLLVALIASAAFTPEPAGAMGRKAPPHLIVAMGDSITVGTFSNTTSSPFRLRAQEPLEQALRLTVSRSNTSTKTNTGQKSWGDVWRKLQSEGLHALFSPLIYNQSTHSWATGRFLDSHEVRIRRIWKSRGQDAPRLKALNLAVPGAETLGLIEQAARLTAHLAASRLENGGEPSQIEYLAMTIGANDSCNSTGGPVVPDEIFESNMRQALRLIATGAKTAGQDSSNPVRVLISAIPPVPVAGGPEFWNHEVVAGITCEKIRKRLFPFCTNLLNWTNEAEFQERMELVRRKNAVLENLIMEARETHPELQVAFGTSAAEARFEPADLAIDCFHPNLSGQRMLSDALWRDQPWY